VPQSHPLEKFGHPAYVASFQLPSGCKQGGQALKIVDVRRLGTDDLAVRAVKLKQAVGTVYVTVSLDQWSTTRPASAEPVLGVKLNWI
jgi:hypothetical protein